MIPIEYRVESNRKEKSVSKEMMYVQCDTVYVAWQKGIIIVIIRIENGEEKKLKINVGERKREERKEEKKM